MAMIETQTQETCAHEAKWEGIGEPYFKPDPEWFGLKKTYWLYRHCGDAMQRIKRVQVQHCTICQIEKERKIRGGFARCLTCNHIEDVQDTTR